MRRQMSIKKCKLFDFLLPCEIGTSNKFEFFIISAPPAHIAVRPASVKSETKFASLCGCLVKVFALGATQRHRKSLHSVE